MDEEQRAFIEGLYDEKARWNSRLEEVDQVPLTEMTDRQLRGIDDFLLRDLFYTLQMQDSEDDFTREYYRLNRTRNQTMLLAPFSRGNPRNINGSSAEEL